MFENETPIPNEDEPIVVESEESISFPDPPVEEDNTKTTGGGGGGD